MIANLSKFEIRKKALDDLGKKAEGLNFDSKVMLKGVRKLKPFD